MNPISLQFNIQISDISKGKDGISSKVRSYFSKNQMVLRRLEKWVVGRYQ